MRFSYTLVAVFILAAAAASGSVEYGVKVGACDVEQTYSYSSYSVPPDSPPIGVREEHTRVGLTIGAFGHWSAPSHLGLMGEAQYTQKGIDLGGKHVNCMCFCALPRYDVHLGAMRLFAAAGPRIDMYLLSADSGSELDTVAAGFDAVFGCGVGPLSVEARYSESFDSAPPPGGVSGSGDVWQILLGWTLSRAE